MKLGKYMSVKEAARQWALSARRVQSYCVSGLISGAEKWGRAWMIPAAAPRPADGRRKDATQSAAQPFLRESPLIAMTDLYTRPGGADEAAASLGDRPGAALFAAYLQYMRGDIDAACASAQRCLAEEAGFYAQLGGGTLLSLCAMHRGDESMWRAAREHIRSAPCRSGADAALRVFWLAAADSAIYNDSDYPEGFRRGELNILPADSQPAARFFYLKHLYLQSANALQEKGWADPESIHRVQFLPCIAEPLIAQTRLEGVLVAELYLRLICAICCHVMGDDARATGHIDRAIELALPDRLYVPLAEYRINLDFLMDERLRAVDESAYRAVKQINRRMYEGWLTLHNRVLARSVSGRLTVRERETSRLAAMGMSNQQIAKQQHVSVSTVKQSLRSAMQKTGAKNRMELAKHI